MCEQCLTEMLSVYSQTKNEQDLYIGIARKDYFDSYAPGDVMIGVCNGPDIVLKDDLFSLEEWNLIDVDEQAWELRDANEDHPADRFNESEPFWAPEIFCWGSIPEYALRIHRHFGEKPENFGFWPAWVVVNTASIFERMGIPLGKKERLEWASQFSKRVDHVDVERSEDNTEKFFITSYHSLNEDGESWDFKEIKWKSTEAIPEELKPTPIEQLIRKSLLLSLDLSRSDIQQSLTLKYLDETVSDLLNKELPTETDKTLKDLSKSFSYLASKDLSDSQVSTLSGILRSLDFNISVEDSQKYKDSLQENGLLPYKGI